MEQATVMRQHSTMKPGSIIVLKDPDPNHGSALSWVALYGARLTYRRNLNFSSSRGDPAVEVCEVVELVKCEKNIYYNHEVTASLLVLSCGHSGTYAHNQTFRLEEVAFVLSPVGLGWVFIEDIIHDRVVNAETTGGQDHAAVGDE